MISSPIRRRLLLFAFALSFDLLTSAEGSASLPPLRAAIETKNVTAPALQFLLRSNAPADEIAAIRALALILTPAAERALLDLHARIGTSTTPEVQKEFYTAIGQEAWNQGFTADGGRATLAALAQEIDRALDESAKPLAAPALAELLMSSARWKFADPHASFLALFARIAASARGASEDARRALLLGWSQTRYVRFGQLPADAPTPAIPDELVTLLATEFAHAKSPAYRAAIVFGSVQWRVPLPLDIAFTALASAPSRDAALDALRQFARFARGGTATALRPYLVHRDSVARLIAFTALLKAPDVGSAELLVAIHRERFPPIRAEMTRLYLANAKAGKSTAEAEALYADCPLNGPYGWARANALAGIFSRLPKDESGEVSKLGWIHAGLSDSFVQSQLSAAQALATVASVSKRIESVRAFLRGVHPLVATELLKALKGVPPTDDATFTLLEGKLSDASLSVRAGALDALSSFAGRPEFLPMLEFAWKNSHGYTELNFREAIVDTIRDTAPSEAGTGLLEKIRAEDFVAEVSNEARLALLARKIRGVPAPRAVPYPYSRYRERVLTTDRPRIEFRTTRGTMVVELYADVAPSTVRTFLGLAENGFFVNREWFRVEPDFVVQGGEVENTAWGTVPFQLRAENSPLPYVRGSLGIGRSADFDSGSSSFFITTCATPGLDRSYTNFGRVLSGLSALDAFELQDRILSAKILRE